jgi:hypothetical protein
MLADNRIDRESFFAAIDDLDWHTRSELLPLAENVSPEAAARAYVRAVPAKNQEARKRAEPHIQVKYGKHRIVDEVIRSLKKSGYIEVRGKGADKEVRLIETNGDPRFVPQDCPCCGSPDFWIGVSGPDTHKIQCIDCGINVERETKPQTIRAWNTRPEAEATDIECGDGGGI